MNPKCHKRLKSANKKWNHEPNKKQQEAQRAQSRLGPMTSLWQATLTTKILGCDDFTRTAHPVKYEHYPASETKRVGGAKRLGSSWAERSRWHRGVRGYAGAKNLAGHRGRTGRAQRVSEFSPSSVAFDGEYALSIIGGWCHGRYVGLQTETQNSLAHPHSPAHPLWYANRGPDVASSGPSPVENRAVLWAAAERPS